MHIEWTQAAEWLAHCVVECLRSKSKRVMSYVRVVERLDCTIQPGHHQAWAAKPEGCCMAGLTHLGSLAGCSDVVLCLG